MKQKIRQVRDLRTVHFGLQTQNEHGYILFASGHFELQTQNEHGYILFASGNFFYGIKTFKKKIAKAMTHVSRLP
jgi:hypothetical protein